METISKKLKKTSQAAYAFTKIFCIIEILLFCLGLAALIVTSLIPQSQFSLLNFNYFFNSGLMDSLNNSNGLQGLEETVHSFLVFSLFPALFGTVILACIFYLAARIFKNIRDFQSPFDIMNAKKLKWIAWLLLALTVWPTFVETVLRFFLIPNTTQPYYNSMDVTTYCMTIIFFALAYIFEYGCMLQTQFDETL